MKKMLTGLVIICAFAVYSNAQSAVFYNYEASLRTEIFKGYTNTAPVASSVMYLPNKLPTLPCDDKKCSKRKCKKKGKDCCAKKGETKKSCCHTKSADAKSGCNHEHTATDKEHKCKPGCEKSCCSDKKTE